MPLYRSHVLVCGGTGCTSGGSDKIYDAFIKEIEEQNLKDEVQVIRTGCFGLCAEGPIVIVYPEGAFYSKVADSDVKEIVEEHLLKGRIVKRLLYKESIEEGQIKSLNEVKFYKKQMRIALRNCGVINPENIEEYIAYDGYKALAKVLTEMTPEQVIDWVKRSGLRGRGGGGFPTGLKWEFAAKAPGDVKYVVCNADEGDPGAYMDRSILEGDPHSVIEAMAIAGYAIGSKQGYVYVRAEYPLAVKRLEIAIEQARQYGLLGKNILGTGFEFDIEIRLGAGAFVCGEETALMTSIEGHRGEPRPRPPFPAVKGLWGKPTLLNNVETYANIPVIILKGPEWFASIGTEKSKGTKVFALVGKVNNTGLIEVPMGTTVREIVEDIGGGIPGGKKFKAVQTGGPSGGCIPASLMDTPIDFDSLTALGTMMGSGGMIVMDEDTCMVDIAKFFLEFTVDESCGKCPPCRIGTRRMLEILQKITSGNGTEEDLEKLEELAYSIKDSALCGLGQTAPNPVLSTLRYFRDEYEAHVKEKRCPAGACKALLRIVIDKDLCKGCGICAKNCPANAITGQIKKPFEIDQSKCIKCGVCIEKCPFKAISKKA
ncbi:NAD(P)-dependent iron-only hydrogenase diaphorase component flavoprotein [Caldicellulosiruptor bescii]|jgi:NADP-reducing hydrogenase subunit HndC|uniref:NADH dehydrogenase (Quinone) n=3 Tax=Caldicellulosiruptor TaxID=44000 RepID=B9MRU4_CALBD|nr:MULTISPECIES: NADH-quinone oxidoreductase subunit NuoF [Caldicellulosiruptor]ACM60398.1 NADH dehydrogenase (quinone) [Caldicellulosiruptor bescii DSM 6725]ADQ46259.1 NADH dehydrogenase (quinone) [Caldicellulosiruptor kronotskyensis 2002]PBC87812.1 NAD(P)-dependent iron-only hydrogenase diaphorase component flavoprotein [Caldicellulosiruptor bescii]PBC90744.1 NAD(P)-dependent iron-only hydrogenase diaphorase component flavoprotein [Caldicellulosiruptor bescii]PBD03823.1 NAD(P)-dependent iron